MSDQREAKLVHASAFNLYGGGQPVWDAADRWNSIKRARIDEFGRQFVAATALASEVVVDVGCGSKPYDWLPKSTICLDRFFAQVLSRSQPVVGDLENLPFETSSIDFVVCVASVLNYVSASEAISEIGRVSRASAKLCLHFETSTSFEHLGKEIWGSNAAKIRTINSGREDNIWVYSPRYIIGLLKANGFRIARECRFHTLSALGLRLGLSQQNASLVERFDRLAFPLSQFSDDFILLAEKDVEGNV